MNNDTGTTVCDAKYKIVFLGDMSVGKSSIIQRFIKGFFTQSLQHTVGIDFLAKNIIYQDRVYRLHLWDTAGQEKFKSLIPVYLRDAHCAVFVYDQTNPKSFESIQSWIELFDNCKLNDATMMLVGNKKDLKDKELVKNGETYARQKGMLYEKVSARQGDGIQEMFESIIQSIKKKKMDSTVGETESHVQSQSIKKGKKIISQKEIVLRKSQVACCSL